MKFNIFDISFIVVKWVKKQLKPQLITLNYKKDYRLIC